ncbi:transcriptional regulator [Halobellus salinus]|uniref:Transcriptional regulator n=1 Tax=Halobellus salinus TaxID=931585 RepID=A0A830ESD8_9EURY|nr:IclR family transcriptional regulator [Halobellus salinus]GGJ17020.1 transcriptional regulator [Halobellus salinus]SMP34395.1 transcriptional regulator, IclR family [Halobellus salinus]
MGNEGTRTIKTADRLLALVEALNELEQTGVTELSDYVDIPVSTTHQYLASLETNEYVIKQDGKYQLGLKFLEHGMKLRENSPLYENSQSILEDLAETTGEIAWLVVEEHGLAINFERVVGEHGLNKFRGHIGGRSKLHTHAAGKALLAKMSPDRVDKIVDDHGLSPQTRQTIQDREELYTELEKIREQGYSFNDNETVPGIRSVGAAITDSNDEPLGAIAVGGPDNRLDGAYFREELPELVLGAVNEIELKMSVDSPW